jgi:hypothetical protein
MSIASLLQAPKANVLRLARYLRVDGLALDYDDLLWLVSLATIDEGMIP